jgi:hypothetical protein
MSFRVPDGSFRQTNSIFVDADAQKLQEDTKFEGHLTIKMYSREGSTQKSVRRMIRVTDTCLTFHAQPESAASNQVDFDDIAWIAYNPCGDTIKVELSLQLGSEWEEESAKDAMHRTVADNDFAIGTHTSGHHLGRHYYFRTSSPLLRDLWVLSIRTLMCPHQSTPVPHRHWASRLRRTGGLKYNSGAAQAALAALVILDFLCAVARAQAAREIQRSPAAERALAALRVAVSAAFLADALAAAALMPPRRPAALAWRALDLLLSAASLAALLFDPSEANMGMLRIPRIARTASVASRLLARTRATRSLLLAAAAAAPPALAALAVLAALHALCAAAACRLLGAAMPREFGGLGPAAFTLYQALSGDGCAAGCLSLLPVAASHP